MSEDREALTAGKSRPGRAYSYYVLAVLCLANILASLDRFAFFILVEPIKLEFHASDTAIGFVSGMAFVIFYVLLGIPVARLADRGKRRNILAASVAIWSVITMLGGLAGNIVQLAMARAGLGAGEAGATPTSTSLIGDYFAKVDRPVAVAVFQGGMAVSAIAGAPIIAMIAAAEGWRTALFAMGIPGIPIALLIFLTVKEPVRGQMDAQVALGERSALWPTLRRMFAQRAFAYLAISQLGMGLAAGILPIWLPIYFMRAYQLSLPAVGAITGFLNGAVMFVSFGAAGALAAWLVRRDNGDRLVALLPAVACGLAVPLLFASLAAGPLGIALFFATAYFFLQFASRPPAYSLTLDLVAPRDRGLATAIIVIANSVVGAGFGPLLVGMISDRLVPALGDVGALRMALFVTVPAAMALCSASFFGVAFELGAERNRSLSPRLNPD